jgi:hypothetical protein
MAAYNECMNYFGVAASGLPMALPAALKPANHGSSSSLTVFLVMVGFAAFAWLLVMSGLAGAWKKSPPSTLGQTKMFFIALGFVVVIGFLLFVHKERNRTEPVRTRLSDRKLIRRTDVKSPTAKDRTVKRENQKATVSAMQPPPAVVQREDPSSANPSPHPAPAQIPMAKPSDASAQPVRPPEAIVARVQPVARAIPAREPVAPAPSLPKRTSIVIHGASALSDSQAKRVCGAVKPYAGTQVYIKWSPGAHSEQLARQLSQAMDCAQVTVTYAAEAPGMTAHGVLVGVHANEGETSDRLRPMAEAIITSLREQGFAVSKISASSIPTDQTAIFIGPE